MAIDGAAPTMNTKTDPGNEEDEIEHSEANPRVKRMHSKVRSGCTTCKTRRIKCDEGKPICQRCLQSHRKCLGYNIPKARLFEASKPGRPVLALRSKNAFNPGCQLSTKQPPLDHLSLRLTRQVHVLFGNKYEEQRSLDFWLSTTGPTMANIGPDYTFWNTLIPQMAWEYPVCRHLLVAMALLDEELGVFRTGIRSELSPVAISHYYKAIKMMTLSSQSDAPAMTVASLMAWVYEALQGNYPASLPAAEVHVKGTLRLWAALRSEALGSNGFVRDLLAQIEPMIRLIGSYTEVGFDDEIASYLVTGSHIPPNTVRVGEVQRAPAVHLHSLAEAREILMHWIRDFTSSDFMTEGAASAQRLYLKSWSRSVREHCSIGPESYLHKQAVQILFNVAMALLPESVGGAYSHAANPAAVGSILDAYERIMRERKKDRPIDDADIELTLFAAFETIKVNIQDEAYRQRAGRLLAGLQRAAQNSQELQAVFKQVLF
ncbi:hypothetical protein PV11_05730 [Exophiala sideris]|uniref:Zn(2)-C6 fungal-type domain-containing protein n=1 Tax=Exophiala sideris TaxID=1016849 RepID=A0A0D1X7C8_9EURO|nr:hypothetical protein PV11_05730 [Exophiala sideris]